MNRLKSPGYLLAVVLLVSGLACSLGTLLVRVPTPTRQPTKTPRPTFTFTPNWTPTRMPTATDTLTPLPPTATPIPPPTAKPAKPAKAAATPDTPVPGDTPTRRPAKPKPTAEPTATPTPQYSFTVTPYTFNTGSAVETRVTGYVIEVFDASTGQFQDLSGYQFVLVDPQGSQHLSNMSGGRNHTTGEGLGDDRWFNTEAKISPYTSGHYRAWLVKDGVQQSPAIEFDLASQPNQYVHLDFFRQHQ
jgi:hypothetical protein